jgi:hypothetical protein
MVALFYPEMAAAAAVEAMETMEAVAAVAMIAAQMMSQTIRHPRPL